jgi:hypothetical protein
MTKHLFAPLEESCRSTLLLGLAIVLASVATARASEVPAQYRGLWCEARDGTYYRCREATSEASRYIRRDRINVTEEPDCRIIAVTPMARGHRLRVRCNGTDTHVNLRLDAPAAACTGSRPARWLESSCCTRWRRQPYLLRGMRS